MTVARHALYRPGGQKVKGQSHTVTKTLTVAWLLVAAAAAAEMLLMLSSSDCLGFLSDFQLLLLPTTLKSVDITRLTSPHLSKFHLIRTECDVIGRELVRVAGWRSI